MSLQPTKNGIDLGIVTVNAEAMVPFYRDVLGLTALTEVAMPRGGRMFPFQCGDSVLKVVVNGKTPAAPAHPGGLAGSTGYRYFTISISNIEGAVAKCRDAGHNVVFDKLEFRPGVNIAMVEDPDGNWIEFLQAG